MLPLVGRLIPIVADDYSDPEKGSGAVKITPAHDFNDFEVGKRHQLPAINILDAEGRQALHGNADLRWRRALNGPDADAGTRRPRSLRGAQAASSPIWRSPGLLDEDRAASFTWCRMATARASSIEPYLTDQWYVDAKTAGRSRRSRRCATGKTQFVPENWAKTYFEWMENIQPWCISRQLWWGHQIPAWYGPDGKVFVAETEDEASHARCRAGTARRWSHDMALDPDSAPLTPRRGRARHLVLVGAVAVLDAGLARRPTSSSKRYYPTNTLVTGFDIIFFWVARMMMMGLHFMGEVPFKDDLHPRARPRREGREDVEVERQRHRSADADRPVRRRCAALHAGRDGGAGPRHQARDVARRRLPQLRDQALERRALRRDERLRARARVSIRARRKDTLNRWIAHETARATREVTAGDRELSLQRGGRRRLSLRLEHVSATGISSWPSRCFMGPDGAAKDETRATVAWVRRRDPASCCIPFMPFITEELWAVTAERHAAEREDDCSRSRQWPDLADGLSDDAAEAEIGWVVDLSSTRSVRPASEMNVPPATLIPLALVGVLRRRRGRRAGRWGDIVKRLARLSGDRLRGEAAPAELGAAHRARRGGGTAAGRA